MIALLLLFKWTILAGAISGPALSLLGCQLATRDRSMQTLCVGQGAMLGVLFGLGFFHSEEATLASQFSPFLFALGFSALTYLATDMLVEKRVASKNTLFTFVFALLLASCHLISSVFPALESHMAQIYFGDLATLTVTHSQLLLVVFLICGGILTYLSRSVSNQSFELAVFGNYVSSKSDDKTHLFFKTASLIMLCVSVQLLGFLFTIAMLFLPTALSTFRAKAGLRRHQLSCVVLSFLGALVGFTLSLRYTRLPTVPAIVATMFIFGFFVLLIEKVIIFFRSTRGVSLESISKEPLAGDL